MLIPKDSFLHQYRNVMVLFICCFLLHVGCITVITASWHLTDDPVFADGLIYVYFIKKGKKEGKKDRRKKINWSFLNLATLSFVFLSKKHFENENLPEFWSKLVKKKKIPYFGVRKWKPIYYPAPKPNYHYSTFLCFYDCEIQIFHNLFPIVLIKKTKEIVF